MKITAWNCNMQFRNKYKYIKHLNYDIGVISECESLDKIPKILIRNTTSTIVLCQII